MRIIIKGRLLNRSQIELLIQNSQGNLKEAIEMAFYNASKLKEIESKLGLKSRRTLQYQLSKLGKKLLKLNISFETIRWSCMIDLFNRGYTAEYISDFLNYSKNSNYFRTKRNKLGFVSNEMRLRVFEKDNFKCVFCGSEDKLQVDHIIPFSKGGKTILKNLQTLCWKCNSGKKAKNIIKNENKS